MNDAVTLPDITAADAEPARNLQIELTTRITIQRLHYRSGDEETALASVHSLFKTTRALLVKNPQAAAFERAALFLLNSILRPYTARWHRWLVDERMVDERTRRQFRYELKQLQPRLSQFADLLRLLGLGPAENQPARDLFITIVNTTPKPNRAADLGPPVLAGIGPEVYLKTGKLPAMHSGSNSSAQIAEQFASGDEVNLAERRIIFARRSALQSDPRGEKDVNEPLEDATGLCLSGGGIRSATFCLGIVQVLVRQGMLPQFDYLSTVSGGGYLGTFLSSLLGTPTSGLAVNDSAGLSKEGILNAINTAFNPASGRESAAVRHIRNHSKYLVSGGLWGRLKIFGLLITGILTNLFLVLPIPVIAALVMFWFNRIGYWEGLWPDRPWFLGKSPAGTVALAFAYIVITMWLGLPINRNIARGKSPDSRQVKFRNAWEAATLGLFLIAALTGTMLIVPSLFSGIVALGEKLEILLPTLQKRTSWAMTVTAIVSGAPIVLGLLTARFKSGLKKRAAAVMFAASGPLHYVIVFFMVGIRLFNGDWHWVAVAIPTVVVAIWGWLLVDVNEFSPHRYYRAKLCECYLAVHGEDQTGVLRNTKEWFLHGSKRSQKAMETGVGTRRQLPLSKMNQTGAAPYHIINTAANLPASHEPNLRGRDCDFFSFSKAFCGGPVCGYFKTEILEGLDSHVDLGTAMAISGAAAASNMGVKTQRQYRFLLTLLNVRLGYWLRNPIAGMRRAWNGPGPRYLFREMLGWMHENSGYLNLSDGGHIENLALYELLRRRCRFIVVVDGGMEPGMECADLMLAQRYAQIDLGVQFNLDIADLALDVNRRSRAYAVFGKIRYNPRPGQSGEDLGWLVYIKLACTGGEPGYVVDYRRQNPDFPHQTTADQIYDEAQFEAYRRLGECAAESLFGAELVGVSKDPQCETVFENAGYSTIRSWFQALANNLLPDNDPAFDNEKLKST